MAAFSCAIFSPLTPKPLHPTKIQPAHLQFTNFRASPTFQNIRIQAANSTAAQNKAANDEDAMSVDNLCSYVGLNVGNWMGSFHQFDANGKLLQKITTQLSAGSYGEDELISLIQTLYIKQPASSTSFSGYEEEPEWAEYKIKESNIYTVNKYQQIGFFPNEKAFSLRYQTAGMLEAVLRHGVLGEDDTGEDSPRNLKIPSRRPSLVCENCLYSLTNDRRARAFHIMSPSGALDMLVLFVEQRGRLDTPPSLEDSEHDANRLLPFLGCWKGHSVTRRSGVYGSTVAEHDVVASLEIDENSQLIQHITSTAKGGDVTTNVQWTGAMCDNLITFDKGFQLTLLPGGMYMGCPCNLAKSVAESKSFHLEFCWLESPNKRQRLVRTYDVEELSRSQLPAASHRRPTSVSPTPATFQPPSALHQRRLLS